MAKRVLDVGQCSPDHFAIRRLLQSCFGVEVVQAHGPDDALEHLRREPFALVLVNRRLDADSGDGLAIVKAIKADPALADVPVMLVSNYADAQQAATSAGAIAGFGKADLSRSDTEDKLRAVLEGNDER
jgi:CheY-like chemotaxis protein